MKITRLKRGYRIDLTDGEFEVLAQIVALGLADIHEAGQSTDLSPSARRALDTRFSLIGCLDVDEDRR